MQGVGFRPWIYRLARSRGLVGWVRNDSEGVWIEVEGSEDAARGLPARLDRGAPPLASISGTDIRELPLQGEDDFRVVESETGARGHAAIPVDAAVCDACLRELFDPSDHRFRYPFINCTDCGPRYTIVRAIPYDRRQTTMSSFALCGPCLEEYENPLDRRFHAEPNACPSCGPALELVRPGFPALFADPALAATAALLGSGQIVALKSLGGFHLAADAANDEAVGRLRARKHRPAKPFAVMVRDVGAAERIAEVSEASARVLLSSSRPIVLLPLRRGAAISARISPGLSEVGVMLPYTPLHHLLLAEGPEVLIMTSGNSSEEPLARTNDEAREKLAGIADVFLFHDREIHTRADDSVVRIVSGEPQPVRRSRGYVPEPIRLPFEAPPVLAVGAGLKNTVCLTRGDEAFLSPHIGDLENPEAARFFVEVGAKLRLLLAVEPEAVAHDLHPDYFSTRWALSSGLPREAVQHHHAHIAACLAEHGRTNRAIGIAFDGTGCGPAGDLWGGEFLIADFSGFLRAGHLRPLRLAGGEAAIREPWRTAAAALLDAGVPLRDRITRPDPRRLAAVGRMLERGVRSPRATGAGRWFDAVAALCGFQGPISYEGQAAAELEALAEGQSGDPYAFDLEEFPGEIPFQVDLRPAVREIASDLMGAAPPAVVSARFHETLARAIQAGCRRIRRCSCLEIVALSGGCFQNRLLTERTIALLESDGFEVLIHRRVPPNDGGVSLGQAAIAAYRRRTVAGGI